jgi:hypothetical protein
VDGKCVVETPIDNICMNPGMQGKGGCPTCPEGQHLNVFNDCIDNEKPICKSDLLIDGKCIPNTQKCKPSERLVGDKCIILPDFCTVHKVGFTNHVVNGECVYEPIKCKQGEHLVGDKCEKIICDPGFHLEKGVCTKNIVINVIKKITTVESVVKNFGTGNQPSFLLLLDTAQLCQLAGDTQCVAKQNQFDTLNLITKLDSTGKIWTITGQVENRVSKTQNNVQVTAYFYDSKGNNVGGPYKGTVNPTVLKSMQLGAFSMKPSTSIMKGTPSFLRLEYQSTTTP